MKTASPQFLAALKDGTLCLGCVYQFRLRNGTVMCFTDCQNDITVGGQVYTAYSVFSRSSMQSQGDMAVDTIDFEAAMLSGFLTERDIRAELYDYAEVTVSYVMFDQLSYGLMQQRFGWLGQVTLKDGKFSGEINGLTQRLAQTFGENVSPSCRAEFCDERCKLIAATFTFTGAVTGTVNTQNFVSPLGQTDIFFRDGNVTFTTGANAGVTREVIAYSSATGAIQVSLPFPYDIAVGDAFTIICGCDKSNTMCSGTYNNAVNMQAEPFVPGDVLTQETPDYT